MNCVAHAYLGCNFDEDMMKIMGEKLKDNMNRNPLHLCCEGGDDVLRVQNIIDKDKDRKYLDATDENGYTPLHYACKYGRRSVVEILIKNNADYKKKEREVLLGIQYMNIMCILLITSQIYRSVCRHFV
jgi:ankyrin repeat protein